VGMGIKKTTKKGEILSRYTSLPSLLHILTEKKLTLLDTSNWDDKNDCFLIDKFKDIKKLGTVRALCLTTVRERYHHWRVFTNGSDGVCIEFDRKRLLDRLRIHVGLVFRDIDYVPLNKIARIMPNVDDLPFLKRVAYKDEAEFRIVYFDKLKVKDPITFPIEITDIKKVTLSPWMNKQLTDAVETVIRNIPACDKLTIERTTLLKNRQWRELADKAAGT